MNIIEIATVLAIESAAIESLTKADFAEMEAKLEAGKEVNPTLTDELIATFLIAIKKHPKAFQAVMQNRALFNFFAKKNFSKKQFPEAGIEDKQPIKDFISTFLMHELNPFVYDKIHFNDFSEIGFLTEAHAFLPDTISQRMFSVADQKLDLAIEVLKPPFGDFSKILYVKDANFYHYLNGLKNETIEEKVKILFTTMMNLYMADKTSELAKKTFTGMKNYHAIDAQLSKNIGMLKESAEINYKPFAVNRTKYYWIYGIVALFVIIRGSMLIRDISEMKSDYDNNMDYDSYENYSEPRKIDRYYTDMRFRIDSFRVFLADYNAAQIRRLTKISNIKTGDNPFETFYQSEPTGESTNSIRIHNSSAYDMLLLENAVVYDSIKLPKSAHFIKAGDYLNVNTNLEGAKRIFNVYMGKKLATFQTESNHLFVRNGSIVEYRFSELVPQAKAILAEDHIFKHDVSLKYKNGKLIED